MKGGSGSLEPAMKDWCLNCKIGLLISNLCLGLSKLLKTANWCEAPLLGAAFLASFVCLEIIGRSRRRVSHSLVAVLVGVADFRPVLVVNHNPVSPFTLVTGHLSPLSNSTNILLLSLLFRSLPCPFSYQPVQSPFSLPSLIWYKYSTCPLS